MSSGIREGDWKLFSKLHPVAVQRFCEGTLEEVAKICSGFGSANAQSAHERYLAVYKLIEERDRKLAWLFNDFRRSTAIRQIELIYQAGFITEDEFAQFSDETKGCMRTQR